MSHIKHSVTLPHGSATEWDMTQLSDEQLNHAHHIAYEALYGHTLDGKLVAPGLLSTDFRGLGPHVEGAMPRAIETWKKRLNMALDETERRFLLSDPIHK